MGNVDCFCASQTNVICDHAFRRAPLNGMVHEFLLKVKHFHYVGIEKHRWKCGQEFFLLLIWNPNIKAINISKLVQMIFSAWFGYFQYVGYLLCGMVLIVLNLIAINFK